MFKPGWGHRTKFRDIETQGGGTPHIPIEVVRCSNLCGDTAQNSKMFKLGWGHRTKFGKRRINPGAGWVGGGWVGGWMDGWVVGWSNLILDPTLALIRAQLGFRIQVRAECGN